MSPDDLLKDIDKIRPMRTRSLVKFAVKCGTSPGTIDEGDIDELKEHGLSDGEIQEAVTMSSFACYANTLADALRVPIDGDFEEILDS